MKYRHKGNLKRDKEVGTKSSGLEGLKACLKGLLMGSLSDMMLNVYKSTNIH